MNLTVRIHDKEYTKEVAQGVTFIEEYNETLDSAVVRLTHIKGQIVKLKPYDDVYIYESSDEENYFDNHIAEWRAGGKLHDGNEINADGKRIPFYRHLLVDKFSEEIINLSEEIYSYSLELFSETKGLEAIQLPNISVTEPLNIKKKVDIYTYLVRFVNRYSPKYKLGFADGTWEYKRKYSVDLALKETLKNCYPQDFSLSNPNLRDVLSSLMVTMDAIPYVKDDVIYAKMISQRTGTYDIAKEQTSGRISRIVGQIDSSDYCDGVRRQYSNALSQNGTCNFVEYLGFRNKDDVIMTLDNMRLETTHKIYRVKKCNMCWYRAGFVESTAQTNPNIYLLYKCDISPLIKLDTEWNLLSQDWRDQPKYPQNIHDLAQFKISTLSYSIGSNVITGWGTRYKSYASSALQAYEYEHTYIENIIKSVTQMLVFNEVLNDTVLKEYMDLSGRKLTSDQKDIPIYVKTMGLTDTSEMYSPSNDLSPIQKLKTIFFEIEYEGFYDGAIIHSRDNGRDNIVSNDNVSSSLTILEKDGIAQKEKLNRFANKTYVMKGRLDGDNYSVDKILKLGETGTIGADNDVIIYRREYSIFDNYILTSYAGIQNYVLKNFYTSVYAKYRVNQLMPYSESTNRSETYKVYFLLSKDKKYKDSNNQFSFTAPKYNYDILNVYLYHSGEFLETENPDYIKILIGFLIGENIIMGKTYLVPFTYKHDDIQETAYFIATVVGIPNPPEHLGSLKVLGWITQAEYQEKEYVNSKTMLSSFMPLNQLTNINIGIVKPSNKIPYFVDEQTFTSGLNVCFNVAMNDNASGGNYIQKWISGYEHLWDHPSDNEEYYIGSTQQWYDIVDDDETGAIKDVEFLLAHGHQYIPNCVLNNEEGKKTLDNVFDYLAALPKHTTENYMQLGTQFDFVQNDIYKDNKELINMTIQLEPITDSKDIIIGESFSTLNDLIVTNEFEKTDSKRMKNVYDAQSFLYSTSISTGVEHASGEGFYSHGRIIFAIKVNDDFFNNAKFVDYIKEQTAKGEESIGIRLLIDTTLYHLTSKEEKFNKNEEFNFDAETVSWDAANETITFYGSGSCYGGTYDEEDDKYYYGRQSIDSISFRKQELDDDEVQFVYKTPRYAAGSTYMPDVAIQPILGFLANAVKTAEVNKNMFVEFSKEPIDKTFAYKIKPIKFNQNGNVVTTEFSNKTPAEVFQVESDGKTGDANIRIDLSGVDRDTKSVNYWYLDFKSSYQRDYTDSFDYYKFTPEQSFYRFVFGVNITPADIERGYVYVYTTQTTHRDERVYDNSGRQIGIVHNCVNIDERGEYIYEEPTEQRYDKTQEIVDSRLLLCPVLNDRTIILEYDSESNETIKYSFELENNNDKTGVVDFDVVVKNSKEETIATKKYSVENIVFGIQNIIINLDGANVDGSFIIETTATYKYKSYESLPSMYYDKRFIQIVPVQINNFFIDPWIDPATGTQGEFRWDYSVEIANPNNFDVKCNASIAVDEMGGGFSINIPIGVIPAGSAVRYVDGFEAQGGTATFSATCKYGKLICKTVTAERRFES